MLFDGLTTQTSIIKNRVALVSRERPGSYFTRLSLCLPFGTLSVRRSVRGQRGDGLLRRAGLLLFFENLLGRAGVWPERIPQAGQVHLDLSGGGSEVGVAELVDTLPAAGSTKGPRRRLAVAGGGASGGERTARDADEMLAEGFGRD